MQAKLLKPSKSSKDLLTSPKTKKTKKTSKSLRPSPKKPDIIKNIVPAINLSPTNDKKNDIKKSKAKVLSKKSKSSNKKKPNRTVQYQALFFSNLAKPKNIVPLTTREITKPLIDNFNQKETRKEMKVLEKKGKHFLEEIVDKDNVKKKYIQGLINKNKPKNDKKIMLGI